MSKTKEEIAESYAKGMVFGEVFNGYHDALRTMAKVDFLRGYEAGQQQLSEFKEKLKQKVKEECYPELVLTDDMILKLIDTIKP